MIKAILLAVLLAGTSSLAAAQQPVAPKPGAPKAVALGKTSKDGAKKEDFDIAQFMGMFDKIFPAQPEPPAALLALSRHTAKGVFPDGTYARLFDEMMSGVVDRVLAMNPAEFAPKDAKGKTADASSLRDQIARDDPHFDERMRITRRVIGEELVKVSALVEPKLREGLARSIARRFDERQLQEINAFLATDSGRAFGSQSMQMWVDPDVMRSMFTAFPDMFAAMPGAMKRLESETAHLPKPKKDKAKAKAKEAGEDEGEDERPAS